MKTENNKIDFLEYVLDGMNTIGILNGSLFYESESYGGDCFDPYKTLATCLYMVCCVV